MTIFEDWLRSRLARVVANAKMGSRALELGVGGRRLALPFAAVSVDRRSSPCVDVVAEIESLPFMSGAFDAAIASKLLCSVRDPEAALKGIERVLKPGGVYFGLEHCANPVLLGRGLQVLRNRGRERKGLCDLGLDVTGLLRTEGLAVTITKRPTWWSPTIVFAAVKHDQICVPRMRNDVPQLAEPQGESARPGLAIRWDSVWWVAWVPVLRRAMERHGILLSELEAEQMQRIIACSYWIDGNIDTEAGEAGVKEIRGILAGTSVPEVPHPTSLVGACFDWMLEILAQTPGLSEMVSQHMLTIVDLSERRRLTSPRDLTKLLREEADATYELFLAPLLLRSVVPSRMDLYRQLMRGGVLVDNAVDRRADNENCLGGAEMSRGRSYTLAFQGLMIWLRSAFRSPGLVLEIAPSALNLRGRVAGSELPL